MCLRSTERAVFSLLTRINLGGGDCHWRLDVLSMHALYRMHVGRQPRKEIQNGRTCFLNLDIN